MTANAPYYFAVLELLNGKDSLGCLPHRLLDRKLIDYFKEAGQKRISYDPLLVAKYTAPSTSVTFYGIYFDLHTGIYQMLSVEGDRYFWTSWELAIFAIQQVPEGDFFQLDPTFQPTRFSSLLGDGLEAWKDGRRESLTP